MHSIKCSFFPCFRQKGYCDDCNCIGCMNTPLFESVRVETMKNIKARNPLAFEGLLVKSESKENTIGIIPSKLHHIKGCHCKKSNCKKKYCECFQMGIKCGSECNCCDCLNCEDSCQSSVKDQLEPCKKIKLKS